MDMCGCLGEGKAFLAETHVWNSLSIVINWLSKYPVWDPSQKNSRSLPFLFTMVFFLSLYHGFDVREKGNNVLCSDFPSGATLRSPNIIIITLCSSIILLMIFYPVVTEERGHFHERLLLTI